MDLLSFAPHAGVVVAIVAITEIIKTFDKDGVISKWYVALPFALGIVLGIPVSFAIGQSAWYQVVLNSFIEAAIAAYLWKVGSTILKKGV